MTIAPPALAAGMTVASPTGHPALDKWYCPPDARRFGVHPYELRRVFARHGADLDMAKGVFLHVADRCGPQGFYSAQNLLRDAMLKDLAMWLIEAAWGSGGWTAMQAKDALFEIRLALQQRFPGQEHDGGFGQ